MIVLVPQCLKCSHFKKIEDEHWFKCEAFPHGIPNQIIYGRHDHRQKYQGDNGIRFEPKAQRDAGELKEHMEKGTTEFLEQYLEKGWNEWSKFRKPKYDPANKKSVAACKKFAARGVYKPGCARAIQLSEEIYEPGKDENNYIPSTAVDPNKMFSRVAEERNTEIGKKRALEAMDNVYNNADFKRQDDGSISVMNWAMLQPNDKQILSSLFDESGILRPDRHREFDLRMKDYNGRITTKGMPEKKL